MNHLYRFRPSFALLDGFQELENQEIYFCPSDELNDPLEGFKDLVWRGDDVVWRNLLRHYLFCLMQATYLFAVTGSEFTPESCKAFVHQTSDDLPDAAIRGNYLAICEEFFQHEGPRILVNALSEQARPVRREELVFYLRLLQPLAVDAVLKALEATGHAMENFIRDLSETSKGVSRNLRAILHALSKKPEIANTIFSASERAIAQLYLTSDLNGSAGDEQKGFLFIFRDYPSYYVNALEKLLYPEWYTACFVANPADPSMWGAYGDGHRGICLKFRTKPDSRGRPALDLLQRIGFGGGGAAVEHYGYVTRAFEKVSYTKAFSEIEFFESLGAMPRFRLDGWYLDPNGQRSTVGSRMLAEDEEWRKEYWEKFQALSTTKTLEWSHEQEYRLTLHSMLKPFDDVNSRKLKYRFADLVGIIFGIKTSSEDKLKTMRIVEQKNIYEANPNFAYYQAHYSISTKAIELAPLGRLGLK